MKRAFQLTVLMAWTSLFAPAVAFSGPATGAPGVWLTWRPKQGARTVGLFYQGGNVAVSFNKRFGPPSFCVYTDFRSAPVYYTDANRNPRRVLP